MLSIIISTYKPQLLEQLKVNIAQTIGDISYEIIAINNPGLMGICAAYNMGAKQAKFSNFLFLHEDVKFLTNSWGQLITKYYNLPKVGVFGIAGNKRKFHLTYGFSSGIDGEDFMFLAHTGTSRYPYPNIQFPMEAKVIDGVFIGMQKKVWEEIHFNEELKGFHFYDLDISLRTSVKYQNYLVTDIDLEHFSMGNFGDQWVKACIDFHKNPNYNYDPIDPKEKRDVRNFWYKRMRTEKVSFLNRLRFVASLGVNKDTLKNCINFIRG